MNGSKALELVKENPGKIYARPVVLDENNIWYGYDKSMKCYHLVWRNDDGTFSFNGYTKKILYVADTDVWEIVKGKMDVNLLPIVEN